jgi:trehalose/maltose hydrolase-like predicted phosphorylase
MAIGVDRRDDGAALRKNGAHLVVHDLTEVHVPEQGPDAATVPDPPTSDDVDVDRRYEAIVIIGERASGWTELPAAISAACADGLAVAAVQCSAEPLTLPEGSDVDPGVLLIASTSTPGCLIVDRSGSLARQRDIDPDGDDDPLTWVYAELWARGIGPKDVLVVRGCDAATVLANQKERRRRHELPGVLPEKGWSLVHEGFDVNRLRVNAALFALADGKVGTSGTPLASHPQSHRWVLVGDTYVGSGPETHLLTGPVAMQLPYDMAPQPQLRLALDLHSGVLYEEVSTSDGMLASVRFSSLARPGTVVFRARCPSPCPHGAALLAPSDDAVADDGVHGDAMWMQVTASPGGIVAAGADLCEDGVVDRVAVYDADPDHVPEPSTAIVRLEDDSSVGVDALLAEHRQAWAARWEDADVIIEGDDELQRAVRFALFHLMASVADEGEAAVGARGLTGTSYRGHVFWDADTFTLPFVAATNPASARAMLEYRIRRLPEAMANARDLKREGARFPWESARSGRDVTPTSGRDRTGRVVPIRTGQLEEHIVAQVAWAACSYTDWTGDQGFAHGPLVELLVQTARYWASRVRRDRDGAHIFGVIGPDEYHEAVNDNAFTNVMARWNLRRAADLVRLADGTQIEASESGRWREIADTLVDGYDADTGIYEQFAGFNALEPLVIAEVAPRRPIAADLLLGAHRVNRAQVLKQADVLMLHHLVPDEVAPGSLEPNLGFYEPRTAHGSSLSPGVHASLLARARNYDAALEWLRIASRIDLDDLTGTTAGGLHLATMGSLWQALAYGFAGLRPRGDRLQIDPRLPYAWSALEVRVRFRGSRVIVRIEHERLMVTADAPASITVDARPYEVGRDTLELDRRSDRWEVTT